MKVHRMCGRGVVDVDFSPLLVAPRVSVPTFKHVRDLALEVLERDAVGNVAVAVAGPVVRTSGRTPEGRSRARPLRREPE